MEERRAHLGRKAFPLLGAQVLKAEGLVDPGVVPLSVLVVETLCACYAVTRPIHERRPCSPVGWFSMGAKSTEDHL